MLQTCRHSRMITRVVALVVRGTCEENTRKWETVDLQHVCDRLATSFVEVMCVFERMKSLTLHNSTRVQHIDILFDNDY